MSTPKNLTLLNLTGTAVDANGAWTYVGNVLPPFTLHVSGSGAGDTVILNGSCADVQPANTSHEIQLASVTSDAFTTVSAPLKWVKARKPAATQSSAVYLQGNVT